MTLKDAINTSKSVLLGITGTSTLILRRGDVEAIAQGEAHISCVIVFRLSDRHAVEIEIELAVRER